MLNNPHARHWNWISAISAYALKNSLKDKQGVIHDVVLRRILVYCLAPTLFIPSFIMAQGSLQTRMLDTEHCKWKNWIRIRVYVIAAHNKTTQNINQANILLWKRNLDPNTNDRTNAKYVWKENIGPTQDRGRWRPRWNNELYGL